MEEPKDAQEKSPEEVTQADGYYGEDELDMDELDLSFLDEDDAPDAPKKSDKAA